MSTVTLARPAAPAFDAAVFVAALTPEARHEVFLALLRTALAEDGDTKLMPVEDEAAPT